MNEIIEIINRHTPGLIFLGARPGMLQDLLSLKIANKMAENRRVLYISYTDYNAHLAYLIEKVWNDRLQRNLLFDEEVEIYGPEFFCNLKDVIRKRSIETVFIDSLEDMLPDEHFANLEKTEIITGLKRLTQTLNVQVILTAEASVGCNYRYPKIPLLQDFKWSRSIINQSDLIISMYRPEYYAEEEKIEHEMVLNVLKAGDFGERSFSVGGVMCKSG